MKKKSCGVYINGVVESYFIGENVFQGMEIARKKALRSTFTKYNRKKEIFEKFTLGK